MMPVVTVPERPNGLPMAIAASPGRRSPEEASSSGLVSAGTFFGSTSSTARSVEASLADELGVERVAVLAEADGERRRALDDVLVGDDVALGVDQEAGAGAAAVAAAGLDEGDAGRRPGRRCPRRCRPARGGLSATAVVAGRGDLADDALVVRSKTPTTASTAMTRPTDAAPRKVKKTFERRLDRFMADIEARSG